MAINDRLKQVVKIGLTAAAMVVGGTGASPNADPQPEKTSLVQQALPQNYSDLLSGENSEKLQPYLDIMRETETGKGLLDSMRNNGVRLTYMDPFVTETGAVYMGAYMPENNTIRMGAKGNIQENLWTLYHEAKHSKNHNKLNKMKYARIPTSTLDDANIANAIDEALAERTAAQGILEVFEKHPEIKDQQSDYYDAIVKNFMEKHPEFAGYGIRENIGNPGLKTVKEWMNQGEKPAAIVQGIYEARLKGYEENIGDYENQASAFYNSGKNNGYRMEMNPDWDQYVTKLTDGQVTQVPFLPEGSVWGLHDRLSSEFSRLGNDMSKTGQMDLSCPISQSYRDSFVRNDIKIYAGYAFASLYKDVPSVQKDILKLTGCNPCETYKNSAGLDIGYCDTDAFKQAAQAFSPQEYMEQACQIYSNPDVQKFLDTTVPAVRSEILAIMTMKDVLFAPDGKVPDHIRPIKQVFDRTVHSSQEGENNQVLKQEALRRLRDVRS